MGRSVTRLLYFNIGFVTLFQKLRAKLRATLLKKNESEQRITHSLGRSVARCP